METNLEWRSSQCDRLRRRLVLDVENVRDGSFTESREVETDPHRLKDRSKPDFNPVIVEGGGSTPVEYRLRLHSGKEYYGEDYLDHVKLKFGACQWELYRMK